MQKLIILTILLTFVVVGGGCAKYPNEINPGTTLHFKYRPYTCEQFKEEIQSHALKEAKLVGKQHAHATADNMCFWGGFLTYGVTWLYYLKDDFEEELAEVRGELKALQELQLHRGCLDNQERSIFDLLNSETMTPEEYEKQK